MTLLAIAHSKEEDLFRVYNTFDGVVVGEFYTLADAEDFTWAEEANEKARIYAEFG